MKTKESFCKVEYSGKLTPAAGDNRKANGYRNFVHQNEAQIQLTQKILTNGGKKFFSGMLAIPTGGGKTFVAVEWLLKNWIDKGKKVLWIAHRHELLDQAFLTFYDNCYKKLLPKKKSLRYRIISGQHDKPVRIDPDDDVIIASKDSLNHGMNYLVDKWVEANNLNELFLVVDEAHHATAKTYRKLINGLKNNTESLKILGLTATPFRTSENESGLLHKIFPDDIVHKTDLRTLIARGILAEPIFEDEKTQWQAGNELSASDLANIKKFDLPESVKKTIANLKERNNQIVDHYLHNRKKYGQLLVFSLNQAHAIALSALFNEKGKKHGIKADFVISNVQAEITRHSLSKENKDKIAKFRKGKLQVLVNVNIVTEGTDLPTVQTVFLTRPTISKILMTQMIGRALRGEKAGGTKKAYIVSFIDNWQDKIAWVNPEKLFIVDNVDFTETDRETEKRLIRLISVEKLSEFALMADRTVDTNSLSALDFLDRIPVGIYAFSILENIDGTESVEKHCEVLVYSHLEWAYSNFLENIPHAFEKFGIDIENREILDDKEIENLCIYVENRFFKGAKGKLGFDRNDVRDILLFYFDHQEKPRFIPFKDRERYDIDSIAKEIYEKDLGPKASGKFENEQWESEKIAWQALFGYNKGFFLNELNLALSKLKHGVSVFDTNENGIVIDEKEQRRFEDMSMSELMEKAPKYYNELKEAVFRKFTEKDGHYFSAQSGYKSKSRLTFEIDHIKPMSKGGKTEPGNLQLLTWWENRNKSDMEGSKWDDVFSAQNFDGILRAAEKGNADAQNHLGILYLIGVGVTKNSLIAVNWYRKAAKKGHAGAQNNLAFRYRNGEGVKQSYKTAFKWHKKAAEKGDPNGQYYLGVLYEHGGGDQLSKNMTKAIQFYREAAKQGHMYAQITLGLKYYEGKGVKKNYETAASWFRKAVKQVERKAQEILAITSKKDTRVIEELIQIHEGAIFLAKQISRMQL